MQCINCYSEMCQIDENLAIFECKKCHLFSMDGNYINTKDTAIEEIIEESVYYLRKNNFKIIIDKIQKILSFSNNVVGLEIGCARGWFMEEAEMRNISMHGIEPEESFYSECKQKNLNVVCGLFPDAGSYHANEFDFIIFNDVFEHIPDLLRTLKCCVEILKTGGLLIINAPDSDGILYKIARSLNSIGINMFWKRLWNVDFYSPHLWYFNSNNLSSLVERIGFQHLCEINLPVVLRDGLKSRVLCNPNDNKIMSYLAYFGLYFCIPYLQRLPADIMCNFYVKK